MDLLGWIVVLIFLIIYLGVFVAHVQTPQDKVCNFESAKFCAECGKRLFNAAASHRL